MPIPMEILSVQRPRNTIVVAYGKNKDRYAVRQRTGCRNANGRRLPVNGPTIGHIVGGAYVPIDLDGRQPVSAGSVDLKDWGNIVLCDKVLPDILKDLRAVYDESDVMKIYCISILRVCYPGIKNYELGEMYGTSFLSELYPGVALSRNTVSTFLNNLGKAVSKIVRFMRARAEAVGIDHHLLIDGTLKSDDSRVNSFSSFSRKARTKGTRDISILYAFDLEGMEPVCSKCFPGNMPDATAYEEFIRENGIKKGVIIGDKGFPSTVALRHFDANPNLHYINPIKRNSKLIDRHNMLDFKEILNGFEDITFRKEKCSGIDKWLYSFRDASRAAVEERDWLRKARKEGNYDGEVFRGKQRGFGTIVLESDLDLPAETVYKAYSQRWQIEIVMRFYKAACEFDETRVQDDYSVIGSEFCDFLSSVLTFRLIREFDKVGLLEKHTYKSLHAVLGRAKKVRIDEGGWQNIRMNPSQIRILQDLELLPREERVLRKRGRPRGSGKAMTASSAELSSGGPADEGASSNR